MKLMKKKLKKATVGIWWSNRETGRFDKKLGNSREQVWNCSPGGGGGGGGVLLGILGGGVPPGSSNPDPISDLNMPFSNPVFRPDL